MSEVSADANVPNSEGALESRNKMLVLLGCKCGDDAAVVVPLLWKASSSHFFSGELDRGGVYAFRSPRLGRSGVGTLSSVSETSRGVQTGRVESSVGAGSFFCSCALSVF